MKTNKQCSVLPVCRIKLFCLHIQKAVPGISACLAPHKEYFVYYSLKNDKVACD